MRFVLANWGTRGEVEPYVTVGRELVRRGHDGHMPVAPAAHQLTADSDVGLDFTASSPICQHKSHRRDPSLSHPVRVLGNGSDGPASPAQPPSSITRYLRWRTGRQNLRARVRPHRTVAAEPLLYPSAAAI